MKAVLISIQPKWCELIASGQKTVEVRKTKPKIETPFKCYIYCTKSGQGIYRVIDPLNEIEPFYAIDTFGSQKDKHINGKVIGEFVCDKIAKINKGTHSLYLSIDRADWNKVTDEQIATWKHCMNICKMRTYGNNKDLYGWHISDLKIYDKPKELGEFYKQCLDKENDCIHCAYAEFKYKNEFDDGIVDDCGLKLSRPPKSWCYVEELEK